MTILEGLWVSSTLLSNIATILMVKIFREQSKDVRKIQLELFRMNISQSGRDYDPRIQGMAEDTSVGE